MTSINPHYTPGMGHKKHTPLPKLAGRLDEVAARVKCGSVELKLTLTAKFLARTLRDALIEPFLKVHNKRAQPLTFEEFACVKLNGNTLDAFVDVVAGDVLKEPAVSVQLVPIAALPSSLLEGFLVAAREKLPARFTAEGYRIPPPPTLTERLVSIAEAANSEDAESDADMARRAANAFQKLGDGAEAISLARARMALLADDYVRSSCFPEVCPHGATLDAVLLRMPTNGDVPSVGGGEFAQFFAALSATACAPPEAGIEEDPEAEMLSSGMRKTGNSFLDQLLDDDSVSARRIA